MRRQFLILSTMLFAMLIATPATLAGKGTGQCDPQRDQVRDPAVCQQCQFVDENGDGVCDNCGACVPKGADDDGDGIPNGQDTDYAPPRDGSGGR